ncbi:MAG: glycosyl transferase, partial [Bacteroidetes bacterium]
MIEHKENGYIADYKSVEDLKTGIDFIVNHPNIEILSQNALKKAQQAYSEEGVAKKYIEVYKSLSIQG